MLNVSKLGEHGRGILDEATAREKVPADFDYLALPMLVRAALETPTGNPWRDDADAELRALDTTLADARQKLANATDATAVASFKLNYPELRPARQTRREAVERVAALERQRATLAEEVETAARVVPPIERREWLRSAVSRLGMARTQMLAALDEAAELAGRRAALTDASKVVAARKAKRDELMAAPSHKLALQIIDVAIQQFREALGTPRLRPGDKGYSFADCNFVELTGVPLPE